MPVFTGARAATDSRAKRELRLSCPECSIDDTKVSMCGSRKCNSCWPWFMGC